MVRFLVPLLLVLASSPARAEVPPLQLTLGVNTQLYVPGVQLGLRWWHFEVCGSANSLAIVNSADVGVKALLFASGSTPYLYGRYGGWMAIDQTRTTAAAGIGAEEHLGRRSYVYLELGVGYAWDEVEEPFDGREPDFDLRAGFGWRF